MFKFLSVSNELMFFGSVVNLFFCKFSVFKLTSVEKARGSVFIALKFRFIFCVFCKFLIVLLMLMMVFDVKLSMCMCVLMLCLKMYGGMCVCCVLCLVMILVVRVVFFCDFLVFVWLCDC